MEDARQLRRRLGMAVVGLLLFLVTVTGVTYAWFTLSGRAHTNVTPMAGAVGDGDTLLTISRARSGPFDKTCRLPFAGTADDLRPVSTADLSAFYRVILQDAQGMALGYEKADARVDEDTMHGTVYLKCEGKDCDVYFQKKDLKLGQDAQALAAMRLGLLITAGGRKTTYIMKLDSLGDTSGASQKLTVPKKDTVVASVSGQGAASYTADPAVELSDFVAKQSGQEYSAGRKKLLSLKAGQIASVEYWLYLEGCDPHCINAAQKKASDVMLAFAGVSAQ